MKFPKPVTYKNKDYLAYIRKQPCAICGSPAEPHHVRRERWGAGTGKKPHDYVTVPLCRYHHDPAVEEDILPETSIILYLMQYNNEKHNVTIEQDVIDFLIERTEAARRTYIVCPRKRNKQRTEVSVCLNKCEHRYDCESFKNHQLHQGDARGQTEEGTSKVSSVSEQVG